MFPTINILGKDIGFYMIFAVIGLLVSSFFLIKQGKKRKIDENDFIILLVVFGIGILIGGHLLFGITNIEKIILLLKNINKIPSFKVLLEFLIQIFGGQVFYGGMIGGLLSITIYSKIKKINIIPYKDLFGCAIPLFHSFGRIGCFLGGCCFGIPCKHGITYHNALVEEANNISRFPVQLLESFLCLSIFLVLYNFLKKRKFKNKILYLYLIIYPVIRFFLEFLRGDSYRGFIFCLSTSQIISILLIIYAIIKLLLKRKKEENEILS